MDIFHQIALEEYYKAILEGKETDSEYVKQKVYERYELENKMLVAQVDEMANSTPNGI